MIQEIVKTTATKDWNVLCFKIRCMFEVCKLYYVLLQVCIQSEIDHKRCLQECREQRN